MTIFSHLSPEYLELPVTHDNGAYFYSKELYERVVPFIKTKRPWCLINVKNQCEDNAIVFIHNNKSPERYYWLEPYKNLILICSQIKTLNAMIEMFPQFHVVYLPLSIDVDYVKQFKVKRKSKNTAYFGRLEKIPEEIAEDDTIDKIYGLDREELLKTLAKYKNVYAIGRCAIEAKVLGCKVKSHEGEYVNTSFDVIDNKEVIPELQRLINEIDGVK